MAFPLLIPEVSLSQEVSSPGRFLQEDPVSIILAQDLMGPQHFLVGQLVYLLQVFVSLKIRPAPCGRRPRVSRWLCVTGAALIPRAQPRSLSCSGQWGLGGSAPDAYRKCFCTDTPAWGGLGRPHGGFWGRWAWSRAAGKGPPALDLVFLPWEARGRRTVPG